MTSAPTATATTPIHAELARSGAGGASGGAPGGSGGGVPGGVSGGAPGDAGGAAGSASDMAKPTVLRRAEPRFPAASLATGRPRASGWRGQWGFEGGTPAEPS